MTIVIGFIGQGCITIASDSQMTYGYSSRRTDAKKIQPIAFNDGQEALIAIAGDATVAERLIEMFCEYAAQTTLDDKRKPAQIAERAIRDLRKEMILGLGSDNPTPEQREDYFKRYPTSLLIAFYYEGTPNLYTIEFTQPIAVSKKNFATLGCGATCADMLLSWFDVTTLDWVTSAPWAVYIIEEIKKVDAFCGGDTNVACVNMPFAGLQKSQVFLLTREQIEMLAQEIAPLHEAAKNSWKMSLLTAVSRSSDKFNAKYNSLSFDTSLPIASPQPSGQSYDAESSSMP